MFSLFFGSFLLIWGVTIVARSLFGIQIPIPMLKLAAAIFLIVWGLHILLGPEPLLIKQFCSSDGCDIHVSIAKK